MNYYDLVSKLFQNDVIKVIDYINFFNLYMRNKLNKRNIENSIILNLYKTKITKSFKIISFFFVKYKNFNESLNKEFMEVSDFINYYNKIIEKERELGFVFLDFNEIIFFYINKYKNNQIKNFQYLIYIINKHKISNVINITKKAIYELIHNYYLNLAKNGSIHSHEILELIC